jgi:acyl-CoA synthetase (AMP-forming)/AMP-acid ligase II
MSSLPYERQVQASTFHPAPVELELCVPELYEYHALNSPSHPIFTYSDTASGTSTSISYFEAWKNIQGVASTVSSLLSEPPRRRPVVAVLAQSGQLVHAF